jgi:hypothetical protein
MSSGARPVMSRPCTSTWPPRGRTTPLIARSSVVLPAPFAPSTAVMLAGRTDSEIPRSASAPP